MSARLWCTAALASVLLHGVGLGAIALSTEPDKAPDQPIPKSRFSIEAAEVPRSRAASETPAGQTAPEATAPTTQALSGAVPQSRAEPMRPQGQTMIASGTTGTQAQTVETTGTRATPTTAQVARLQARLAIPTLTISAPLPTQVLSGTTAPSATVTAAALPVPSKATALTARPAALAPTRPAPTPLTTASAPEAVPLTATSATVAPIAAKPATGRRATPATPETQTAALSTPNSQNSTALPLPALAGKAALAWSGQDDTPVSATSLAAIAAFTQAGDLTAQSAQVRDGIAGILSAVPCARLQTTFLPDTGQLELRGHIPEDALRGPVLAALQEQIGDAIALSDQLLILPRPQCGALTGIADVGLPQSTEQLTDPAVIGEDGFARTYAYVDGERLRLDLTAPDYDSYIYMDYFVADGSVIHLQPNEIVPLEFAPAKSAQSVGRIRSDGGPHLDLTIAPPFGQEIAAAFASNVPLYEGTRPIQEPAGPYLAFLKERVGIARANNPDFKGEWVYFFISTRAQ